MGDAQGKGDRVGAGGYGCLVAAALGGFAGGAALVLKGIAAFMGERERELANGTDAAALWGGLETAVVFVAVGALLLLFGFSAGVVLLKELADETSERRRGPVR